MKWNFWQKAAFRFFFIFLLLQVLTENFLAFTLGLGDMRIWNAGAAIFTPPCLWLNDHIFHYKYIPQTWSSFSGALHTIRDIMYLLFASAGCVVWSVIDKRRDNYNKLFYWFSRCVIPVLSTLVFAYGISKLIPVQMKYPGFADAQQQVGNLSPYELIWLALGYGQPYQIFTGLFEVIGAVLILFRQGRVAGLIIIACIIVNVVMIDYTYVVGNVLVTAFYIFLLCMFLLAPHLKTLYRFFISLGTEIRLPKLLILVSFALNTGIAWRLYVKRTNTTEQCSIVKTPGSWKYWVEKGNRVTTGQGVYTIHHDHDTITLKNDSATLVFKYTNIDKVNWCLQGKNTTIELQRIDPDTMLLFKTKRVLIIFDDYSDQE